MGASKPPESDIDLVDSFARLVGAEVEVVLAGLGPEVVEGAAVVLRRAGDVHRGHLSFSDTGYRRGVVRFERSALSNGQYTVSVEAHPGEHSLGCRLLVQGSRPLVLLWGAEALPSRRPVPHPRPEETPTPVRRARSLAGRARRAVSRRVRARR